MPGEAIVQQQPSKLALLSQAGAAASSPCRPDAFSILSACVCYRPSLPQCLTHWKHWLELLSPLLAVPQQYKQTASPVRMCTKGSREEPAGRAERCSGDPVCPAPVGARRSPQGALPGLGASGRAGAGAAPRGGSAGRVPPSLPPPPRVPTPRPASPAGAVGLPRSSSHGACPAGGTALLLSRRPLTGTRRGRRGLVGAAAGGQVGTGRSGRAGRGGRRT